MPHLASSFTQPLDLICSINPIRTIDIVSSLNYAKQRIADADCVGLARLQANAASVNHCCCVITELIGSCSKTGHYRFAIKVEAYFGFFIR